MVKKDQVIELEIDKIVNGGEGLGYYNDFAIFVPMSVPKDRLKVKIISVKKTYARGLIEEIISPGAERVEDLSKVTFEDFQGCDFAMLQYDAQLKYKKLMVEDVIEKIGKLKNVPIFNVIGSEDPYCKSIRSFYFLSDTQRPAGTYIISFDAIQSAKLIYVHSIARSNTSQGFPVANTVVNSFACWNILHSYGSPALLIDLWFIAVNAIFMVNETAHHIGRQAKRISLLITRNDILFKLGVKCPQLINIDVTNGSNLIQVQIT